VSIIAQGCFHPVLKVQSASLHFFLGSDDDTPDSDDDDDEVGSYIISQRDTNAPRGYY
jgi:protein SDA1